MENFGNEPEFHMYMLCYVGKYILSILFYSKSKQKQTQVTSHSNWPCVLMFDLTHKQCSGIIKDGFTVLHQSQ